MSSFDWKSGNFLVRKNSRIMPADQTSMARAALSTRVYVWGDAETYLPSVRRTLAALLERETPEYQRGSPSSAA